jgi:hypothetical protein
VYSPRVINSVLDDFEAREGWRPEEHSIAEVEEFSEYLGSIIKIERNERSRFIDFIPGLKLTQRRKAEIQRWVQNEQFLCFANASYFKTRYAHVCNEAGDIFRYKPRKSQEVFSKVLEEFDDLQVAIEIFVLKFRQGGISTEVALDFLHRLLFVPNSRAVQASVNQQTSDLLSLILQTCIDRIPFWLPPMQTSTKAGAWQWANGSIMSIQSGSQAMGIAQGWTPNLIHISEVADIPRPKKVLEEGLFKATHSTRKLFFVLEGTGGESTSWQAEKWRYYKANWGKGGRFLPLFISWPCCPDLYPTHDWIRKNPIPEGWGPMEETRRMMHKAQLFIRSTPHLSRIMGNNWSMPREQQWYWETNYREAAATHTTKVWLAQMPVSDDEALQSKHDKAISDEVIEVVTKNREKNYTAYAITGDSVLIGQNNEPYEPPSEMIDYDKEIIPVRWKCKSGQFVDWELVPLKEFNDKDDTLCFNKVLVFQMPREGADYSIGVDTADGLGNPDEDRAVASVALNRQGNQRDDQVAEFVSNNVNPAQMVTFVACLAAWYGQWHGGRPHTSDPRGVKIIIEQRERPGDDCQHQLKLMGFSYHHRFTSYDGHRVRENAGTKDGWFSNVWSRPMLLNRFSDAVSNGWYRPNSPGLIRELADWIRKTAGTGTTKLDHQSGKHDDRIMSAAMAYMTRHAFDILVSRQQSKFEEEEDGNPPISFERLENTIVI